MTIRSLRLLSLLLLAFFTFCSIGSSGPAHLAKQYFVRYDAQDVDGFLNLMSQSIITKLMKDVKVKNAGIGDVKNQIKYEMEYEKKRHGDLESVEVLSEDILKDVADVRGRVKYRNLKTIYRYRFRLVKEDSQWKVDDKHLEDSEKGSGSINLNI